MPRSRGMWAFWLTAWALCLSAIVVAAAFLAPVYQGETATSSGGSVHTSGTLVGVNGLWVAGLLMVPVVLTLLAGIGLHRRCSRGSAPGTGVAWGAVAVLAALTVLGAASIGFYLLPITVLLATAVALTPSGAPPLTRR